MPRYYLNLHDDGVLIEDPDGHMLSDLDAARAEALMGARSILAEKIKAGQVLDGQRIEIMDEAGTLLDTVLLKDAIKLA